MVDCAVRCNGWLTVTWGGDGGGAAAWVLSLRHAAPAPTAATTVRTMPAKVNRHLILWTRLPSILAIGVLSVTSGSSTAVCDIGISRPHWMNRGRPCAASAHHPARRRAIALISDIVGVVAIARALDKIDTELSRLVSSPHRKIRVPLALGQELSPTHSEVDEFRREMPWLMVNCQNLNATF